MNKTPFQLPPLEWIRAFEAAARCGSFTAAAAETGLTQSAISQRISNLEKELGTQLFSRQARSIALTVDGEAWLPHVRAALTALRDSSETLFGRARGRLTISASQSVIQLWLLPRLKQLQATVEGQFSFQTMVLGVHEAPVDEVIRIRYGTGDWPHPHKVQLFEERIVPLASPELARRRPDPWTKWPRIACAGPRPGWSAWATRFGVPTTPVPELRFDTFLSALEAARAGAGAVLGSLPLCLQDLEAGRLVRLGEDEMAHHETYWALAGSEALGRAEWETLCRALATSAT